MSNVNFAPGTVDPNVATATIGADGRVCFLNSEHATVNVVADHLVTIATGAVRTTSWGRSRVDTRWTGAVTASVCLPSGRCLAAVDAPVGPGEWSHTYGFVVSTDGGLTWSHSASTFPTIDPRMPQGSVRQLSCTAGRTCTAVGEVYSWPAAGSVYLEWVSHDLGESWSLYSVRGGGYVSPAVIRTLIF